MEAAPSAEQTVTAKTIVVGADASPESNDAIEWARAVAGPDDQIVLLHAWQLPVVTGYDMVVTVDPHEIEDYAVKGLDEQITQIGDARIVPVVMQGHAGRSLVSVADEREASMIVVGHRGKSRVAMMLGSTANYVLHHTTRPVIVLRGESEHGDERFRRPRKVVVGVDDHDLDPDHLEAAENPSVRALRWAYGVPGIDQVRVVHAWFLPSLAIGMFADMSADLDAMDAAARAVLDHVMTAAGPPPDGVTVDAEPVRGTPGFALIEESHNADLVVVGSRGRGGFTGLLLGSTTVEVAAHSHAPVAVIR